MMRTTGSILFALLVLAPSLGAQDANVRAELLARGAPLELANQVHQLVVQAAVEGLPAQALVDKALEGWAKNAPADRVLAAVTDLQRRLGVAREIVVRWGSPEPPGPLVSAAAEAIRMGMTPDDVGDVIRSAGPAEAAATGLVVASSLAAQGLEHAAATQTVERAYRDGHTPTEVLELPSLAALMIAHGMTIPEVTRRMLAGRPLAVERPDVARPLAAPPTRAGDPATEAQTKSQAGRSTP